MIAPEIIIDERTHNLDVAYLRRLEHLQHVAEFIHADHVWRVELGAQFGKLVDRVAGTFVARGADGSKLRRLWNARFDSYAVLQAELAE